MGRGVYLFSSFATGCGCEVEIQAMQVALFQGRPGNSIVVALAVRVATTVFLITDNGVISVNGGTLNPDTASTYTIGGTTIEATPDVRGSTWQFVFPGGAEMLLLCWFAGGLPTATGYGYVYNTWLTIPADALSDDAGLCSGRCSFWGPFLPIARCTETLDQCFPVPRDRSLFPADFLAQIEGPARIDIGASTRQCDSPKPPPQSPAPQPA